MIILGTKTYSEPMSKRDYLDSLEWKAEKEDKRNKRHKRWADFKNSVIGSKARHTIAGGFGNIRKYEEGAIEKIGAAPLLVGSVIAADAGKPKTAVGLLAGSTALGGIGVAKGMREARRKYEYHKKRGNTKYLHMYDAKPRVERYWKGKLERYKKMTPEHQDYTRTVYDKNPGSIFTSAGTPYRNKNK